MQIKITLTPFSHYFLGTERNFEYNNEDRIRRQFKEGYFIRSKNTPSQTTLFGTLRYLLGVENEKLKEDYASIIGGYSYNILRDDQTFGKIRSISNLFLEKGDVTYIPTPMDHLIKDIGGEYNKLYTPMEMNPKKVKGFSYPQTEARPVSLPKFFVAKDGITKSWMSVKDQSIVSEDKIFLHSVEVVSNKQKKLAQKKEDSAFAKKEYVHLARGFHFTFYAEVEESTEFPEMATAVLGKDSSAFAVTMQRTGEYDELTDKIQRLFENRDSGFSYCISPAFVSNESIDKAAFSILTNEPMRIFESKGRKLGPADEKALLNLVKAGSIFYTDDVDGFTNKHARVAGMNILYRGGRR